MAVVRGGHQGADAQALGGQRRRSKGGDRPVPRAVAEALPREMVVGVGGVESELFGPTPHPGALGPTIDGKDDGTDAHPQVLSSWADDGG